MDARKRATAVSLCWGIALGLFVHFVAAFGMLVAVGVFGAHVSEVAESSYPRASIFALVWGYSSIAIFKLPDAWVSVGGFALAWLVLGAFTYEFGAHWLFSTALVVAMLGAGVVLGQLSLCWFAAAGKRWHNN